MRRKKLEKQLEYKEHIINVAAGEFLVPIKVQP